MLENAIEVLFPQGSEEWKAFRKDKIGGSDVAAILGLCNWKSAEGLLKEKASCEDIPLNEAMLHGIRTEPEARKAFEEIVGKKFHPKVFQRVDKRWCIASLDGLSDDGEILEIKCPSNIYAYGKIAKNKEVPVYYYAQLQHQMFVCDVSIAHFFSFWTPIDYVHIPVTRDDAYIEFMGKEEENFWKKLTYINTNKHKHG